uniref:Uncharacterized protein n=1 Tax=Siphoviridae sp. ctKFk2 TaxID=2827841 RepID=A0A8S5T0G0_9CAUD|nr:MAG TPA: hypothetical protein [Siphoviridae sp. ctKFk2]DAU61162.1 MAG TPA: hypothetical protein [Caudoviricetes sp.]
MPERSDRQSIGSSCSNKTPSEISSLRGEISTQLLLMYLHARTNVVL